MRVAAVAGVLGAGAVRALASPGRSRSRRIGQPRLLSLVPCERLAGRVPTDPSLRSASENFAELWLGCERFCERVNARAARHAPPAGGDASAARGRLHLRVQPLPGVRVRVVHERALVAALAAEDHGQLMIAVPAGAEVAITAAAITVKGPLGTLVQPLNGLVKVENKDGTLSFDVVDDSRESIYEDR